MTNDAAGQTVGGAARLLSRLVSVLSLIVLLLIVFVVVNIVHFRGFTVRVVAYDALLDVAIAAVISAGLYLFLLRRYLRTNALESILSLSLGALGAVLYAIAVPTVIDRSLSVYLLEKLQQRGGAIREAAFEDILIQEFFPEHQLVAIRLTEQLNSGTITISDGCVRLTPRGQAIAQWTRLYRTTLLPRHREIMGRFTDDLTDPFRHSEMTSSYRCP